jgi:hypothetical protein
MPGQAVPATAMRWLAIVFIDTRAADGLIEHLCFLS